MFWTVHATTGLVVAQQTHSPLLGFIAGYASHFVLDAIPHGDEKILARLEQNYSRTKSLTLMSIIDSIILIVWLPTLYYFKLFQPSSITIATIFGSLLPDWLTGIYIIKHWSWLKWNYDLNESAHRWLTKSPVSIPTGLALQFITLILSVWYLGKF